MIITNGIPGNAAAVTPSDTTEILAAALYVGGAGDVSVVTEGEQTVTFSAVPAGAILPIRCTKVRTTGTDATNIVRLY